MVLSAFPPTLNPHEKKSRHDPEVFHCPMLPDYLSSEKRIKRKSLACLSFPQAKVERVISMANPLIAAKIGLKTTSSLDYAAAQGVS
jgi:hypothetical protein